MERPLNDILTAYDAQAPLAQASTLPSSWYTDPRIYELERRAIFSGWQVVGRCDQVAVPGAFFTIELAGEPIIIVRGSDNVLRGFFNVCRHHAAAVVTQAEGQANVLRCPYHGWTYGLDGALRGTPSFGGVCDFNKAQQGLIPIAVDTFEQFVCVRLAPSGPSLQEMLEGFAEPAAALSLSRFRFMERRIYTVAANWKVYVDNYLDGSYHVPHLHKALSSIMEHDKYSIENGARFCLQRSPLVENAHNAEVAALRAGGDAAYYWLYPNFMLNCYRDAMDTNLVLPLGVDRTQVIFDIYCASDSEAAQANHRESVALMDRIQQEDAVICESVQRGLGSRAYEAGRLSVQREAGEHLFHRLVCADLQQAAGVGTKRP